MKILICGAEQAAFRDNLISRLNKEKHEIFVLSGNRKFTDKKTSGVFQKYDFLYTDDGVSNIIENISPEIIVFMGAMDINFSEEWTKADVVYFVSGLTNVVLSAKANGVKKFVYLSDLGVYEGNTQARIDENTSPVAVSERYKAILEGENICNFYRDNQMDIEIVRVGEVYGGFDKYIVPTGIVESLTKKVLNSGNILCNKNKVHLITYLSDAIEAVYQTIAKKTDGSGVIFVPGENKTEQEIVSEIANVYGRQIELDDVPDCVKGRHFCFELEDVYGFYLKYNMQKGILQYIKFRGKHLEEEKARKEKKKHKSRNAAKFRPFFETIIIFILLAVIQYFFKDTLVLSVMDIYLLYVVLIATVHGMNYALLAIVLSTIGKFTIDVQSSVQSIVVDYSQYLWVLEILIAGVFVGLMRDKYWRRSRDLEEELDYTSAELGEMMRINESNVYVKNIYERRLINYKNSLARIYEITSQLDYTDPRKVVFRSIDVVREIMECDQVSVYSKSSSSSYFRLTASCSKEPSALGKSFNYEHETVMREMLEEDGVFRNNKMTPGYPLMASAVKNGEETVGVIMIWDMDMNNINLYQINLLKILTRLIEKSMTRANQFMDELYEKSYYENTRVMRPEILEDVVSIFEDGKGRKVFRYITLVIQRTYSDDATWIAYVDAIRRCLRESDVIGIDKNGDAKILLSSSTRDDAAYVIERLKGKQVTAMIQD